MSCFTHVTMFQLSFCTLYLIFQGGQWILGLVDNYGVTFVVFVLATVEMIGVAWIYGKV